MVKYITCILDSFEANLPITPNVKPLSPFGINTSCLSVASFTSISTILVLAHCKSVIIFYFNVHTNMYLIFIYSDTSYCYPQARRPIGDVLNNNDGTAFNGPAVQTNGNVVKQMSEIAGAHVHNTTMERTRETDGQKHRKTGGMLSETRK